ncbi:N-acetylneuraminate synthase [Reinekea blandensis]|uniref:Sialic acid synthase n=1 Tax=Reinekea blandensis MED297 TaxID=314283 RepID=A4BEM9_9GAMM|nr:N-acetylneuraminate synthase [Reinekea blandensis]EAR09456.1 sialic acid synthase [Reinekea sp. MED297] [Reinekea blandensis MED297]
MKNDSVFLIAEAGVNHNGDVELAKELIELAAAAGADAIKFQTFIPEALVTTTARKAGYQKTAHEESQLAMLQALALPLPVFDELKAYADSKAIEFMSTAFESESLALLSQLAVRRYKIPSGELTNLPFLIEHAALQQDLILSTGMATLGEIELALASIYWGRVQKDYPPSISALRKAWIERDPSVALNTTLLHCTSSYPAAPDTVNIRAMTTLAEIFQLPVGYSDHTQGTTASIMAIAKGARVIEKHVTLDKTLSGPDHRASMSPAELHEWVAVCREAVSMLGDGNKQPQTSEMDVKQAARKSLVAKTAIRKGDVFTSENLAIKRPGTGRPPEDLFSCLNQTATRDYLADEFIE